MENGRGGVESLLLGPVVRGWSSGLIYDFLDGTVETELGNMDAVEQETLRWLRDAYWRADYLSLEGGASICSRHSNGEDAVGATALALYREAQRRAPKH